MNIIAFSFFQIWTTKKAAAANKHKTLQNVFKEPFKDILAAKKIKKNEVISLYTILVGVYRRVGGGVFLSSDEKWTILLKVGEWFYSLMTEEEG